MIDIYSAILTLFLLQDPLGNIPIVLSLLHPFPNRRRIWIIIRENLIAFTILSIFLFSGNSIFAILKISESALSISGGMILIIVALKIVFPPPQSGLADPIKQEEPFIVPLALPLLAGPSAIATVLLFASQNPGHLITYCLALISVTVLSTLILLAALPIQKILGQKFIHAFERIAGMLLIMLGTQMLLNSFKLYFIELIR